MRSRITGLVAVLATLIAAAGCSEDSSGPNINLTGSWTYTATNISGSGVSCNVSTSSMTLTQTGNTFTGSATGQIACVAGGQSVSNPFQGQITNGTITGNAVQFELSTADARHIGTVSGNSMSGTLTLSLNVGAPIGTVVLTGNWSAVKQ